MVILMIENCDMRYFMEVVRAYSESSPSILVEDVIVTEQETLNSGTDIEFIVEDLKNLKKELLSISSDNSNSDYAAAFEAGLYKSVEMLENFILEKFDRRI